MSLTCTLEVKPCEHIKLSQNNAEVLAKILCKNSINKN